MSTRLSFNPGNYTGTNVQRPPETYSFDHDPSVYDWQGYALLDLWLNTINKSVWILVSLAGTSSSNGPQASWVQIGSSSGNTVTTLHTDDTHNVTATSGVINLAGSHGINTTGTVGPNTATVKINNTITLGDVSVVTASNDALTITSGNISLSGTGANAAGNINLPSTSTDGRQGAIFINGTRFMTWPLGTNVFLGGSAGNFSVSGAANCGFGNNSLQALTSGIHNMGFGGASLEACTTGGNNVAVGFSVLGNLTTGGNNTAIGADAGVNLVTGSSNTLIGSAAGGGYTTSESSNIAIQNNGTVGESNVIRIGSSGSGAGQQNKCFIVGIYGITTTSATTSAVLISNGDQLGTMASSKRFKNSIEDMGDQSSALMKLRPVTFQYNAHKDGIKQWGLIAEEVQEVLPEIVNLDQEGLPFTVRYHDLPALLLNELQKLSKRVAELERKLNASRDNSLSA